MNAEQNAAGVQTPGRLSFGQQFREVGRLASRQLAEPQWMQASRSIGLDIVFAGARVPRLIWGAASAIQAVRSGNNAGALAGVAAIGLGGAVGAFSSRGLRAADLGLSGTGITNLVGEVTNAGTTRIVSVASITAANNALLGELRGAVPNMLSAARAEGVKTLQITASFGNDRLASFAASQAAKYQGVFSSVAGQDVITFVLGAAK